MSIRMGNVEYIMAQMEQKRRHQIVISTGRPPPLEFNCVTLNKIHNARNFEDLSSQNACLEKIQKMQNLIIIFANLMVNKGMWC